MAALDSATVENIVLFPGYPPGGPSAATTYPQLALSVKKNLHANLFVSHMPLHQLMSGNFIPFSGEIGAYIARFGKRVSVKKVAG